MSSLSWRRMKKEFVVNDYFLCRNKFCSFALVCQFSALSKCAKSKTSLKTMCSSYRIRSLSVSKNAFQTNNVWNGPLFFDCFTFILRLRFLYSWNHSNAEMHFNDNRQFLVSKFKSLKDKIRNVDFIYKNQNSLMEWNAWKSS